MGASNSTRRVVIEDSSGSGVAVTVSQSVVRRLKGETESEPKTDHTESRREQLSDAITETRIPSRDSSQEVKKLESYYQSKLAELEKKNASLLKQTTAQFAEAVQEVEKKFLKTTGPQVCPDLQTKVYQCYQANPDQTLECSSVVRAFVDCVERARQNALLRKG
ncbi:MICOS complex subunit MIC19-like [Mytilus edulis]|uniref:CHCHD3 n=1 Tax=Mytilus edulis TaxID=6550 RepID=A0A8S3UF83_MYTED|nr:CHCHD3 [Mytilus edulis]